MMAASLAGCGSGNQNTAPAGSTAAESKAETEAQKTESGEKVKLTFWMEMTTPELDQVYQTAVDNYMSEHPDVEIEYLGIPGNAADAKNKLEMAIFCKCGARCFPLLYAGIYYKRKHYSINRLL